MLLQRLLLLFILSPLFCQSQDNPVDPLATTETKALYHNLKQSRIKGFLFGHQDDLAYGVNWKYVEGKSDCKTTAGDYPGIYGWELGRLELDQSQNLDGVPFESMRRFIIRSFESGGVITISWHLNNPLTGKSAWDPAPGTVTAILPGGSKHDVYKSWLDKVAYFLNSLKTDKGVMVPVIFRPFHELNGSWFWWGKNHCSPAELKTLFQFTETYLRNDKNLHHLLYAFNTDKFYSKEEYMERYPGDEWVDVVGFDIYQRTNDQQVFFKEFDTMLGLMDSIADEHKKIPALTEFGYGGLPVANWWTTTFSNAMVNHNMAYALAWRNAGKKEGGEMEFYIPYEGQLSEADFRKFHDTGKGLFLKQAAKLNLYRK